MADVGPVPSFGAQLKDGFKSSNAWVSNGIAWLDEIQQFYRERATIEKEYSSKLYGLAKRNFEKKAKRSSSLSRFIDYVDHPAVNTRARAAEHDRYSSELLIQIAEPLKILASRYEELRKSHAEHAAKLERERDASYSDLRKQKGRYDGSCQENLYIIGINVTNKQKERYYHEYVPNLLDSLQDLSETRVAKLNSLWSQAVLLEDSALSRSKDHLEHLSVEIPPQYSSLARTPGHVLEPSPVWLDDSAMVTDETAKIFLRNVLGKSKGRLKELKQEADKRRKEVENVKRIRQNIKEGRDKRDEVELVRAMFSMHEDLQQTERNRLAAEVETTTITSAVGDVSIGAQNHNFKPQTFKIPTNCDLCGERIWGLSAKGFDCRDCGYTCHSKCEMKVPAECPGEQSKEEKKKLKAERQMTSNAVPTPSNGNHPEGVSELPALSRSNTMTSLSSGYAASANRSVSGLSGTTANEDYKALESSTPQPVAKSSTARRNRIVAPPPAQYVSDAAPAELNGTSRSSTSNPAETRGKMLYPYQATGEGEVSVEEGQEVTVIEQDDGSGWLSVRVSPTISGLVPAAYLEQITPTSIPPDRPVSTYSSSSSVAGSTAGASGAGKKKGPVVAPKRGAKKLKYVEALYDYEARSDAEHSMTEGERIVLVTKDAGDGWADVEKGGVRKSVPANYIQEV